MSRKPMLVAAAAAVTACVAGGAVVLTDEGPSPRGKDAPGETTADTSPDVQPAIEEKPRPSSTVSATEICSLMFLHTTVAGAPTKIEGPCGEGARLIDAATFTTRSGTHCANVTYIVSAGTARQTRVVCLGDARIPGVPSLTGN